MADYLEKAARVKLVVIGVDGVLTDAGMYFNDEGDMLRKFNRRDGMGIQLLGEADIPSAVVSSLKCPIVEKWCRSFDVEHIYLGVRDKFHAIENLSVRHGITLDEVAYISDDIDELAILEKVGFGVSVADGTAANKKASAFVTKRYGGQGAVREVIEVVLYSQQKGPFAPA